MKHKTLSLRSDFEVAFAVRDVQAAEMTLEEARAMRGSGWIGDLEEMRATRTFE